VKDWHRNLNAGERNLLTQIFRFFTQADVETVHIAAYSHLLDTAGMPEIKQLYRTSP
jgi:ribonucleoside-diphosphate reductase beta chain